MKLTIIIAINCFVIIVNFRNRFDKALTEIFQFRMALAMTLLINTCQGSGLKKNYVANGKISLVNKLLALKGRDRQAIFLF